VPRKKKPVALILVLLGVFTLAIVLLLWRGLLSTLAMMVMMKEQERFENERG
jgi:NAD(P)H-dependent FMN reductase